MYSYVVCFYCLCCYFVVLIRNALYLRSALRAGGPEEGRQAGAEVDECVLGDIIFIIV